MHIHPDLDLCTVILTVTYGEKTTRLYLLLLHLLRRLRRDRQSGGLHSVHQLLHVAHDVVGHKVPLELLVPVRALVLGALQAAR